MINFFTDVIFILTTIYISLKAIGYCVYEIKEKNNKLGGICVAVFSIAVCIFANIMLKKY